jgi:hypothetical protein
LWFSVHPVNKVLYSPKMGFQLNVGLLPVNPEKKI